MTTIKTKYNRRSFLTASAAAGGGMMLGFSWLASCTPAEEASAMLTMPDEWFEINAFLKIGDNGVVTIYSPNPEIGQNVKTSMPMIVAEELDVDWKNVLVEQAPLNTVKYQRQIAGGSQSIRAGWDSLRMAGATARHMLIAAAATQWEVPAAEVTTEAGIIKHEASGKSLGYGDVASAAAGLEVPEEVPLKERKDYKLIGTNVKNVDGPKIVTGDPLFGLDVKKEGMLIAMIVHPPAFGMKVKSIDDTAVRSMAGVRDVFTFSTYPEGIEKTWSDANAFPELVAVVGESTWQVMKAKKALQVEWETTSKAENTEEHKSAFEKLLNGKMEVARRDGNPEAAFRNAAEIIERTYSAPFLAHNTMEPMNFFADVREDGAELIGPIQTPENMRKTVAQSLGMEEDKVSVMMSRMGGGFGRRLYGHFGIEAAVISQKAKAPVKLVYTREDDMTQGTYRPAYMVTYRAALDENKNLTAIHIKGTGIGGSPVFENRYPAGAVENYLVERATYESNISTGAWRAPRSNFIAGAEQSFLDEVAEVMGQDPIEFRLALFEKAMNNPVGEKNDYDAERYAGVLKLIKEKAGWGSEKPGISRGVSAYYCHNSYVAQVVDLSMKENQPVIEKVWAAVDCGIVINPDAACNIMEGGAIDGIGHAMYSAMTFKDGIPQQENFDSYRLIRHREAPLAFETFFVENDIHPTGLGEPGLPPVSGALANAWYKATGERKYHQPFIEDEKVLG
ncbi:MAG: xanthine dehydrogenase family protein molybdopterin-binding subunit [Saprospiraceae bacterium]|nr:xanthine dehydrogenase family protein molybdopterin-binding subunit [Saprospiraceae bacterium]